jgi:hypothetical protein
MIPALVMLHGCSSVPRSAAVPPPVVDGELVRIQEAVETALACAPRCAEFTGGVKLLSVSRAGNTIVLDFSGELLSAGTGGAFEDEVHRLIAAASSARSAPRPAVEDYRILVKGVPLDALR